MPPEYDGRLVFSFGVNDCAAGPDDATPRVGLEAALENARAILGKASAWRPTLMIGPLPVAESPAQNHRVIALSEALAGVCDAVGAPFFSTVGFAAEVREIWRDEAARGDGIHPNALSYAALAQTIRSWAAWRNWFAG